MCERLQSRLFQPVLTRFPASITLSTVNQTLSSNPPLSHTQCTSLICKSTLSMVYVHRNWHDGASLAITCSLSPFPYLTNQFPITSHDKSPQNLGQFKSVKSRKNVWLNPGRTGERPLRSPQRHHARQPLHHPQWEASPIPLAPSEDAGESRLA